MYLYIVFYSKYTENTNNQYKKIESFKQNK